MVRDLKGLTFGRLSVTGFFGTVNKKRKWNCVCSCGGLSVVATDSLMSGKTTSCGCRKKETSLANCLNNSIKPRHGLTNTRVHKIWSGMLDRVKPVGRYAENYYLRGITVCERWNVFENFFEDMGHPPEGKSLDRVDVDKGYCKENCRWATATTQARNKQRTRYVFVDGVQKPLMELAEELGMKKSEAQYFFSAMKKFSKANLNVAIKH